MEAENPAPCLPKYFAYYISGQQQQEVGKYCYSKITGRELRLRVQWLLLGWNWGEIQVSYYHYFL